MPCLLSTHSPHCSESAVSDGVVDDRYPAQDPGYVLAVHTELMKDGWACQELHSAVMFAWAVLLREAASRAAFVSKGFIMSL